MMLRIIDEITASRAAICDVLKTAGYEVSEIENAGQLLSPTGSNNFIIAVVRDGGDFAAQICREIKTAQPETLVLQISPAGLLQNCGENAFGFEPEAVLAEDFTPCELLTAVKTLLRFQKSEAELRLREERYRALVLFSSEAVWGLTSAEDDKFAPKWWEELTGQSPESAKGWGWLNSVHPEEREQVRREWLHSLENLLPYRIEYRVRTKEGEYRHIAAQGLPLFDCDGEFREWIGTLSDVTEQRRTQEALTQQSALINLSHEPIFVWEIRGNIIHWNRGCEDLYGFSIAEALGRVSHELLQTQSAVSIEEIFGALETTGKWSGLVEHRTRDGKQLIVESRMMLADLNGRRLILEANHDVTERERAAREQSFAEEQLRRSEERYRAFIEQSSEGIWRFELSEPIPVGLPIDEQIELAYKHGFLAECNDAMARQYGFENASELTGKRLDEFLIRTDPANYEYLKSFMKSGYRLTEAESHERGAEGADVYFLNNLVGVVEDGCLVRAWGTQRDITEQKRAEQRLRESEKMMRQALQTAQMLAWNLDLTTNKVTWSPDAETVVGFVPGSLGETLDWTLSIVHPEDRQHIDNAVRQALRSGKSQSEVRIQNPANDGGNTIWMFNRGEILYDETGKPVRMVGVSQNITERKRAEEELIASAAFNRTVLESSADCVKLLDLEGRLQYMNEQGVCLLELDDFESVKGRLWQEFWGNDLLREADEAVKAAREGKTARFHGFCPTMKGNPKWWDVIISPVRNASGEVVKLLSVSRDVTETKTAQRELERLYQLEQTARYEIETAKNRLFKILDSITDGFLAFDREWRFTYANREGARTLGRPAEELLGKNLWEEFPELADSKFGRLYRRVVEENAPQSLEDYYAPFDAWFSVRCYPTEDGLSLFFLNITERKLAETEISKANERFRVAEEASNGFLYDWDAVNNHVERSDAFTRVLGYELEEFDSGEVAWTNLIHEDDRERAVKQFWEAIESGKGYSVEYRVRHKEGHFVEVIDKGLIIRNASGKTVRVIGITTDISEIKQAQAKLRESEERFRLLTENLDDVFWIFDWREKRSEYLSPAFERMLEINRQPMLESYKNWTEFIHAEDRQAAEKALLSIDKTGKYESEYRIMLPGGEVRWLYDKGLPIFDEKGEIIRVVGVAEDITERKKTEDALRESQAHLTLTTEAAQVGTWQWNIAANQIIWSPLHKELWGYPPTPEPIDFENWRKLIDPDDLEMADNEVQIALRDGTLYDIEYRIYPSDGSSMRWIRSVGQAVYDENGEAIQMLGISTDITRRKASEEQVLRLNQELEERVEELQKLLEVLPVGVGIAKDATCQEIYANRYLTEVMNLPHGSNISASNTENNRKIGWRVFREDKEVSAGELPLQRAISEQQTVENYEFDLLMPEATTPVSFLSSATPLFDKEGKVRGAIGAFLDMTERKRIEREREEALERERLARADAEAANRAKDEFLAVLSHELRTPLNSMFGWVRMLNTGQLDADKTRRAVEVIEKNIGLQTKLIEDILDVSRIISGKIRLEKREFDFLSAINSVIELTRPTMEAKRIKLEIESNAPTCIVNGDSERLQQVVSNLISNAVKFTPSEGSVTVSLNCENNLATLTVTDTGVGIEPEFLPHVFDRFRQADSSTKRRHGGLGLGLAIVKHLIELHGGHASAMSDGAGRGASFIVSLPIQSLMLSSRVLSGSGANGHDGEFDLENIRILLVDDDTDALEMLRTMLSAHGAKVTTANAAKEGLKMLKKSAFDVLVSDIGMPEMDGIEFLGKVRRLERERGFVLPAIALTAYASPEDRERILAAGFNRYLPKPINFASLLVEIRAALRAEARSLV